MTGTDAALDLDALIAEVEADAAKRRAAPGWPVDAEERIAEHLARTAPAGEQRPSLDRLVTSIEEASFITIDVPTASSRRVATLLKVALKKLLTFWFRFIVDQVTALGVTTAQSIRAVVGRLEEVERRLDAGEQRTAGASALLPAASRPSPALDTWQPDLVRLAVDSPARTLYADERAAAVVAAMQAAGADAYGLERTGDPFDTSLELRHGDLLAHLAAVGEGALGAVLLAGCTERLDGASLAALVPALARALRSGGTLALTAEAPWSWQVRVGSEEADLAGGRPLAVDTWLARLHDGGFTATASYADDGRSYLVTARR